MLQFRKTFLYDALRLLRDAVLSIEKFNTSWCNLKGIISAHRDYGWIPDEYFLYDYPSMTDNERENIIPEIEHSRICKQLNSKDSMAILADKWQTYKAFCTYFQRDAVLARGGEMISLSNC